MSAIGAVPGYSYPSFDYASAELYENRPATVTATAPGSLVVQVAPAVAGNALFVREVFVVSLTSAVVGTRGLLLELVDGDGNLVARYDSPANVIQSSGVVAQWSIGISTAYTVFGGGYTPMPAMVIPTGWVWYIAQNSSQIGDKLSSLSALGLQIPNRPPEEVPQPLPPQPLFA